MEEGLANAPERIQKVEDALAARGNDGPFFNDDQLSLVDAAYAPFLQRFAIAEGVMHSGLLGDFPLVQAWSDALLANDTVIGAVPPNFAEEFEGNHRRRETHVWSLMEASRIAAE